MDAGIQGAIPLRGPQAVGDQKSRGQKRGDPEAFRRALQEEKQGKPGQQPAGGAEPPLPRALQPRAVPGRKEQGAVAHHVDVLA